MGSPTYGWTIRGQITGTPREVAQYHGDIVRPLQCCIYAPTFFCAPAADTRVRARLVWGTGGAAEQRIDFDFRACRVAVIASSMRLQLYLTRRLYSTIFAGTAPVPIVLSELCTVVLGPGTLTSTRLIWSSHTNDVVGSTFLGDIPPWAKSIALYEHFNAGVPIFAPPVGAGVDIYTPFGVGVDSTIRIPAAECWRMFAPIEHEAPNAGGACNYTGPVTPASLVSAVFELEV